MLSCRNVAHPRTTWQSCSAECERTKCVHNGVSLQSDLAVRPDAANSCRRQLVCCSEAQCIIWNENTVAQFLCLSALLTHVGGMVAVLAGVKYSDCLCRGRAISLAMHHILQGPHKSGMHDCETAPKQQLPLISPLGRLP